MVEWVLTPLILNLGTLCLTLHSPFILPNGRTPQYVLNRRLDRVLGQFVRSGKKKTILVTAGN